MLDANPLPRAASTGSPRSERLLRGAAELVDFRREQKQIGGRVGAGQLVLGEQTGKGACRAERRLQLRPFGALAGAEQMHRDTAGAGAPV